METINQTLSRHRTNLRRDERGLSTVEYVIVLVLIAAASVGGWSLFGQTMRGKLKTSIVEFDGVRVE